MRCDFCKQEMESINGWIEGKAMCSESCKSAFLAHLEHQKRYLRDKKWI